MKFSTLLVAASATLNVALITVIVAGVRSPKGRNGPDHRSSPATALESGVSTKAPVAAPAASIEAADAVRAADIWSALHQASLAEQRDRLRAEGVAPSLIRSILIAQMRDPRLKAHERERAATPYWQPMDTDPAVRAEMQKLTLEERARLKELLGSSGDDTAASLRRQFPSLSADKIEKIAAIRDSHPERLEPTSPAQVYAIEKAERAEIAAVLSPHELDDYEMRTSSTANRLRQQLSLFNPSESEFRALYNVVQAAADSPGGVGGRSGPQLNEQIKGALGSERYADFQRATDPNYRLTTQLAARLELPPETADRAYAIQNDISQRARSTRQLADRAALATEAQAKITALMGPQGYEAYKQYGGTWIETLARSATLPSILLGK